MKTTDVSEEGLESIVVSSLVEEGGYVLGSAKDYDREHAVDLVRLLQFLAATQPEVVERMGLDREGSGRVQFLDRLRSQIAKRGVVDVLRKGISHGPVHASLFFGMPTPGNLEAAKRFASNIFSVTRQLRYSRSETARALDMAVFVNGLPVATFELKNRLTGQTVEDAVLQYMRDRDEKELLFQFGRCAVHFAVDDLEVRMCASLQGERSWFLPFNKGCGDGAGNPPNPSGLATDYLWKEILTKESLTDILENYAQMVEVQDDRTGRKKRRQIFPRHHQLQAVRMLLADALQRGVGRRCLIQHSAGSGKSNSIAWLAHQLAGLLRDGKPLFDSVVVVTDRKVLDRQIRDAIRQFAQVSSMVGHAERAGDLRRLLREGKKIVVSTVQKFPFVLEEMSGERSRSTFAAIIDEAHSGQGGRSSAAMNTVLDEGQSNVGEEETTEDRINRIMEGRKMAANVSYFAFTATPKNKTLEIFGEPDPQPDGTVRRRPFHSYTMKQAIQEGFILDVLQNYVPVATYCKLAAKAADDPFLDANKARRKLRRYVECHEHAIRQKAEIMVEHFLGQVVGRRKIGGEARAMVATSGIEPAIQYFEAVRACLRERKSAYEAVVAFSGEHEHGGRKVAETTLNGFPSSEIPDRMRRDPYRFLIVADKFQTGYDEPLLHAMYVDKPLSGVKAVQTLSRLNRAHPQKRDTFVLDFCNDPETIRSSFEPYYRTTILSSETDPNKLHDLEADLERFQVYSLEQVDQLADLWLRNASRERLDPILDACAAIYADELNEDGQVEFKGKVKAFLRTWSFLSLILPWSKPEWEKLSLFLGLLVGKLPAPKEEDLSRGVLEAVDMDSYRAEVQAGLSLRLSEQDMEIDPVPASSGGSSPEPELERLSSIVSAFNEQFGDIEWKDADKIAKVIAEEIPAKVAASPAYRNAMQNSGRENARIEHDAALRRVMLDLLADHAELFKQYSDNASFKKWLGNAVFEATYALGDRP